jgi:predicted Rdx family selenoprotein
MRHKILVFSGILLMAAMFNQAVAQTKCVWMVKSKDGAQTQKVAVSLSLVKLLAGMGGDFDINGVKIKYESLLQAYRSGSVMRIKDDTENGETKVYGGEFDQEMKESSEMNNRLIIESSKNGGEPEVSKIRVKSIEAIGILLAMIGSKDLDEGIDRIESALEQGGVLYVRDYEKDSSLWIYVN